jgi:RNA polymerase sigma-70 factor (ECF subfamily)
MDEEISYKEKKLLEQVARGSETAFRLLYDIQHQRIYSFALFLTHSEVLAEEVTQEIFIKIWNHRTELSEIRQFDAWLKTLVRNQCYTFLNRLAKERLILQEINEQNTEGSNFTEENILFSDYSRLLQQLLDRLPEQQRKVFILSRQEGIKHEEIARQMGLSINTIKSHMKAALRNIRQILGTQALSLVAIIGRTLFNN